MTCHAEIWIQFMCYFCMYCKLCYELSSYIYNEFLQTFVVHYPLAIPALVPVLKSQPYKLQFQFCNYNLRNCSSSYNSVYLQYIKDKLLNMDFDYCKNNQTLSQCHVLSKITIETSYLTLTIEAHKPWLMALTSFC